MAGLAAGVLAVLGSGRAEASHDGSTCYAIWGEDYSLVSTAHTEAECAAAQGDQGYEWTPAPATTTTTAAPATTTTLPATTTTAPPPPTTEAPVTTAAPTTTTTEPAPTTTTTAPPAAVGYATTQTDVQVAGAVFGLGMGVLVGTTLFHNTYRDNDR